MGEEGDSEKLVEGLLPNLQNPMETLTGKYRFMLGISNIDYESAGKSLRCDINALAQDRTPFLKPRWPRPQSVRLSRKLDRCILTPLASCYRC